MKRFAVNCVPMLLAAALPFMGQSPDSPQQAFTRNSPAGGDMTVVATNGAVTVNGADRLAFLTSLLALSTTQQEQIKSTLSEAGPTSASLYQRLREAAEVLRSSAKAGASDFELDQLAVNLAGIFWQILAVEARLNPRYTPS
jgi:hypothetical protein